MKEKQLKTNKDANDYDKLKAISLIADFVEQSNYTITDTSDYTVSDKTKAFTCDMVNHLNMCGYTIVKKG